MYRIGIDIGSTFTKYCVMCDGEIESLTMERTPVRQKEYFDSKLAELRERYDNPEIISCGYGKRNIEAVKNINELTALAQGTYFIEQEDGMVLDIGGQDTKIIRQRQGRLQQFFINDKCAAGSGMFLTGVLDMLGLEFYDLDLTDADEPKAGLSSVCAVFAQSEIVEMIAGNRGEEEILQAVIWHIFVKARTLLGKVERGPVILSGGMSQIKGIGDFAEKAVGRKCRIIENSAYLAAVGCASWSSL